MIKIKAYQRLSDMIYKGFLTLALNLSDRLLVLKTINEKEYDLIKLYSGVKDENYISRFNRYFLIFSLLLVDGENILSKRENRVKEFYDYFKYIPNYLYNQISDKLRELRTEAEEIIDFLEGFCYTGQSRRIWKLMRDKLPNSEKFTGISGTGKLGLNIYQENWILINRMLDEEEEYNRYFSLAVLIASAHNSKGARSISSRHDAFNERNKERRTKLAKEGSSRKQRWKPTGWAASVDTAEELVDELTRQMEGKKDKHDLFIEAHLKKLHEKAEKQVQETEQRLEEIRKKRKMEGGPSISSAQRVLSKEESDKLMSKKPDNNLLLISDRAQKEDQARFYKKIGKKVLTARK